MQGDKHITQQQLDTLLRLGQIPPPHRREYVEDICRNSKVMENILLVSSLNLRLPTQFGFIDATRKTLNVSNILHTVLNGIDEVITAGDLLLAQILNDPSTMGVTVDTLRNLLPNDNSVEAVAYLLGNRELEYKEVEKILTCGCCNRKMKSVVKNEGVCVTCKNELLEFVHARCMLFTIPKNHFNFSGFTAGVGAKVTWLHDDSGWAFESVDNDTKIVATIDYPDVPYQGTLPMEEFQKKVVI